MSDDPDQSTTGEDMMAKRSYAPRGLDVLWDADPEYNERYDALAEYTIRRDDALSRKHRELFIAGFAAIANRTDICRNHIEDAYEHGATDEELLQLLQLATHIGGAPTMATAGRAVDDLGLTFEGGSG